MLLEPPAAAEATPLRERRRRRLPTLMVIVGLLAATGVLLALYVGARSDVSDLEADAGRQADQIDELTGRVGELESAAEADVERIAGLERSLADERGALVSAEDALADAEAQLGDANDQLDAVKAQLDDAQGDLDAALEQLEAVPVDDVFGDPGLNDGVLSEAEFEIAVMYLESEDLGDVITFTDAQTIAEQGCAAASASGVLEAAFDISRRHGVEIEQASVLLGAFAGPMCYDHITTVVP